MKNSIFLIFLLIIGCNNKNENNNIYGNYYLLSKDSIYSELFITDTEMAFYNDITEIQFSTYHFKNDTLITKGKMSDFEVKYLVHVNNDSIVLNPLLDNQRIYLKRIVDSGYFLKKSFDKDFNYLRYKIAYANRRNHIFGISKRWNYDSLVKSESSDSIPKTVELSY